MSINYILSDYIENALDYSEYDMLQDCNLYDRIKVWKGVIAFGSTLTETGKRVNTS
jgi:hypothetical protein